MSKKISEVTEATSLENTDVLPLGRPLSNEALKVSVQTLTDHVVNLIPDNAALAEQDVRLTSAESDISSLSSTVANLHILDYGTLQNINIVPLISGTQAQVAGRDTANDSGGGIFIWDSSDLSAQVSADSLAGIYVAPTSDLTGASGAWQRAISGVYRPEWWGITDNTGVTDYAEAITALFTAATGSHIVWKSGSGVYKSATAQVLPEDTVLDLRGATLKFVVTGSVKNLDIRSGASVLNGTIENAGASPSGSGQYQCPILIGDYGIGTGYSDILIENIEIKNNRSNGNGIMITGDSHNITIRNISFPASVTLGRPVLIHWGGADTPASGTTHPYNIDIQNLSAVDQTGGFTSDGALVFISGAYNVTVDGIDADNIITGVICYAGDYGDQYASVAQAGKSGSGVSLQNVTLNRVAYRGFKVDGLPTISGTAQKWSVYTLNYKAVGTTGSNDGVLLANCDGVIFDSPDISDFRVHGVAAGAAVHRVKMRGGQIHGNYFNGVYISNGTTPPEDWILDGVNIYGNNAGAQTGDFRAGVNLGTCKRPKIRSCTFGAGTETQLYSVRASSGADSPLLENNWTEALAGGGAAYSIGSSTDYAINAMGSNNRAAVGVTTFGGAPISIIDNQGLRHFAASAPPASGAWLKGETVDNNPSISPGVAFSWVCVGSGTPGTWRAKGREPGSVAKTADYTVVSNDEGGMFSNQGATGTITFALPASGQGMKFTFIRRASFTLRVDPNGSETIRGGGTGKYISLDTDGAVVELECHNSGAWEITSSRGTLTYEP